ncbi:hypothetical protein [Geodermatophilus sp. URMC 63]
MALNLSDLPQAVKAYLNDKVTVTVSPPKPDNGESINPGETFKFTVTVTNAPADNGGIALSNVRFSIRVANPDVIKIRVPTNGSATDISGDPIAAGSEVGFLLFDPTSSDVSTLRVGETDTFTFTGRAGSGTESGSTTITARILADPNIDALFPRNGSSSTSTQSIAVVG